jgi:membrane fusion protein (multidrug efflux system)
MKFSRTIFATTVSSVLILFLGSCSSGKSGNVKEIKSAERIMVVEGYVVKQTTLDQTVVASGTLKAFEETVLMPDVSGRVVRINFEEGNFVKKGTLLIKLYDEDLQAEMKKLQTQLSIAEQTKKRQTELLKISGISELEYDQTTLQVSSIRDDIEVLNVEIRKTEVLAPFDGTIGLRNVSIGAQVTTNSPLATIRENNLLKLDFGIPEKYSSEVFKGKIVKFTVQGSDSSFSARIIASEGGIESSTRNLKVRAVVENNNDALKTGAFARVELPLKVNTAAMMIPTQSIIPQERNKQVILVRNGAAVFTTVTTGVRQNADIEVTDGLVVGDTVLTTGLQFVSPGAKVKFSKIG